MAAYHSSIPPSIVVTEAKSEASAAVAMKDLDDSAKKQSREDWRKMKELEEMRKAGTAPAAQDEEGRDINPHIPQYIVSCPWYVGIQAPTLTHQRPQGEKEKHFATISDTYDRGLKDGIAMKFKKGACENCGSMTHKKKDCMERPRKLGARFTGEHIAPDEKLLEEFNYDFDGKRDRWNGYDSREHKRVIEEFMKMEEAKRIIKAQNLADSLIKGELPEKEKKKVDDSDSDADEEKYVDEMDMPGTKIDSKQRISVRNLRIREDTAKYLRNLDPNSAYYDPKTRAMRDNPYKNSGKREDELEFAGDNFIRAKGDTLSMASAQVFSWEAAGKGIDVHLQAEPTKLELLAKEYDIKKDVHKNEEKDSILTKYGGSEHLEAPPKALLLAQTEEYIVYNRLGKVIEGQEKQHVKSKYIEDEYIQNHTCVWGSYWKQGQWGYKCCHAVVKQSYCTGESGKVAEMEGGSLEMLKSKAWEKGRETKTMVEEHQEIIGEKEDKRRKRKMKKMRREKRKEEKRKKKKKKASSSDDDSDSSDEETKRKRKVNKAIKEQEEESRKAEALLAIDERKRPYNSFVSVKEPTEEEMEAFRLKNLRDNDPMAQFGYKSLK